MREPPAYWTSSRAVTQRHGVGKGWQRSHGEQAGGRAWPARGARVAQAAQPREDERQEDLLLKLRGLLDL